MAISYTKTNWVNGQSPAINATNLNNIENGVSNATSEVNSVSSSLTSHSGNTTVHITSSERSSWNTAVSNLSSHTGNSTIHVTSTNKSTWNAKYDKPSGGIPKTDLASAVQTSLGLADSAVQMITVWSNSATSGTFAAQSVSLTGASGCTHLMILFKRSLSDGYVDSIIIPVGSKGVINMDYFDGTNHNSISRFITASSTSSVTFTLDHMNNSTTYSVGTWFVPYKIIGIKGVR